MFQPKSNDLLKSGEGFARIVNSRTRQGPEMGTKRLLDGYNEFPWIRAISDKIGNGIGSTVWTLSAGDLKIESNPLLDLLRRPNPQMSGKAFFKWSGTQFALVNECFWLIERNGVGLPIELWPLPAHWVNDVPKGGQTDGQYEVVNNGQRSFYPESEIIWIRDFGQANPYGRSSSPARALGDEIESDEFAAKYVKSFFMNNARPDLLIYGDDPKNPLDKASATRLEQTWLERLQGVRKRFKPFFLPGKVGVKDLQSNLKDMDLVDQRKWWRDIAIQVYGIPPEALGIIENSNRATIQSANYFLQSQVIVPKVEIFADGMTLRLASEFDKRLTVGFVNPVQDDKEHKLKVTTAHPHAFSVDEIRADAGVEELENGAGEVFPYQFNTLFGAEPGGGIASAEPTDPIGPKALRRPTKGPTDTTTKELDDGLIESIIFPITATETFSPDVKLANTEAVAGFGQTIIAQVESGVAFNLTSAPVEEFLLRQSSDRITMINETTRSKVKLVLQEGVAAGEGAAGLSKRIGEVFEDARGRRAFTIARTETVRAANFGSLAGMKQVGVKQKQWLSVSDGDTRDTHQSMNGQVVGTDNYFTSPTGSQALHPGGFGIAEEDIECRCSILAVVNPQADINIPSMKDFEQERTPYERLMERAYVKGFDAQEEAVMKIFNNIPQEP